MFYYCRFCEKNNENVNVKTEFFFNVFLFDFFICFFLYDYIKYNIIKKKQKNQKYNSLFRFFFNLNIFVIDFFFVYLNFFR